MMDQKKLRERAKMLPMMYARWEDYALVEKVAKDLPLTEADAERLKEIFTKAQVVQAKFQKAVVDTDELEQTVNEASRCLDKAQSLAQNAPRVNEVAEKLRKKKSN